MPEHAISKKSEVISRRHFSKVVAANAALGATAVGALSSPCSTRSASATAPSERLNIACIGVGGQGAANVAGVSGENIVALSDVDERRAAKAFDKYQNVRRFPDFRRMFDAMR